MTIRRVAGISGLLYVVGVSIENMDALDSPTLSSSISEIRELYADHAFAVVTSVAGALALLAYATFAAVLYFWLREQARSAEPWATVMLLGGIGGPVVAAVGLSANAILVANVGGVSDEVAGSLYDFYLLCRIVSAVFVAMFLGGIGFAALRSGALPRPLPQLSLAIGGAMVLAPIAAFNQTPGLELAVAIAFASQTLWIFLTSMWITVANGMGSLAFIRRCAFLLLVMTAGLIGIALLAVPAATGRFFAWGLGPEPLAALAGGVYVGSATAYAFALPRSAAQVRALIAGAALLSISVFIVTLTHTDQFDFDRLQAIMWVVLFASFSLITLGLFAFEESQGAGRPEPLATVARAVLAGVALLGGALGLALWIDPTSLAGPSPFDLPPLGGRFAGSWIALLALVCGWATVRNRVDEARASAVLLIAMPAGALLAALRTIEQLEPTGAAAAYITALAVLSFAGVVVMALTPEGHRSGRT
jgi:hypothetical protein